MNKLKAQLARIIAFRELKPLHWVVVFIVFIAFHIPAIHNDRGHNAYYSLAEALESGQLAISIEGFPNVQDTEIPNTGDLIYYNGKYYLPYPPAPALLLIPFVLMDLGGVNCTLIAVLLSCINLLLLYKVLTKIDADPVDIPWLIFSFFFGSCYWYVLLTSHHVYGFAEVVSVTGILLLLNELFGRKRAVLMGLFIGMSFLSRQFTLIIALFVIGYLIHYYILLPKKAIRRIFWKKLILFFGMTSVAVSIYLVYNYARFGSVFDTGYAHILFFGTLKSRVETYGVFSPHYVLYNLYNYLFKGFNIQFIGDMQLRIKDVDLRGTALLLASPFVVFAFKTKWNKFLLRFIWMTIGLIFIGLLFYHNNGMEQVNASRFTLDFYPLLMVLIALGAKYAPKWLFRSMVIYAILLNVIAFAIHFIFHTLG